MSDDGWRDMIVGERMTVDRAFEDRIAASPFSRQQWGLVMTAVEFRVSGGVDAGHQLVADTSKLGHILPELDRMANQGMAGPGAASSGRGGGGLFGSIKSALGIGDGADDEQREAAERMATEYAKELQSELEESGKWETVVERATTDSSDE